MISHETSIQGFLISLALISNLNGEFVKNGLSLRIRPSYSDDMFGYTLSLPCQFLELPAHGEWNIEHVCGLLIINSCIRLLLLASIDIHLLSA